MHPNGEMTAIGYLMAAVLVVAMLPLAPFLLAYLVVDRLVDVAGGDGGDGGRRDGATESR